MKHVSILLGITSAIVLAGNVMAAQGDWPQWRGPKRDGVSTETGLLKEWPATGPKLAWKITGLGAGYSGVAVSEGRIFTLGETPEATFLRRLAVKDGAVQWSVKVGKAGAPGWGGFAGPRCTPTVDGDLVYAVSQFGEMVCVQAADGKEVWRKHVVTDLGGKLPEWGFAESPLVDGDRVMYTPGGPAGAIVALNKKTGELVWRTKSLTDQAQYSSIVIAELCGVRQYVQMTEASVVGLAPEDGRILWRAPRQGKTATIPTPIVYADHVYVTSGYEVGCNLFKITKSGNDLKAEQVYANHDMENHHGGVVRIGEYLYGYSDTKKWICQDFKTGKVVWRETSKIIKGSIAAADGMLFLRAEAEAGTVMMIAASPEGFVEKGRFDQPDRSDKNSWPHPVIANGKLYLRDQGVLLCYELK